MAEKDAFLIDYIQGGLCVDYTNARIVGRCNSGSNMNKGKELWDSLESKYMAEDSLSKKFLEGGNGKDDLSLVQLGGHLRIEESLRAQDSDKGKGKEVGGTSFNMTEEGGKKKHHKQNKGKNQSNENNSGSSSNKKPKLECWKCGKSGHSKIDFRSGKKNNANAGDLEKGSKDQSQDQDRCWFNTYEPVEDRSVLYIGDDHFAPVHGKGSVALEFSSGRTITLFNVLYLPKLRCRAVARLPDPKWKTLGEKGIDCIFVRYAEHSKAYRPKDIIPNSDESQRDDHSDDVPNEIPEPRKGCKWIFKRKMKVDETVDKFKARLVIQGFRQKEWIDYFDTYALVARITTIRLLLALAAIHNSVIHQIDVKTAFLNGDLEEEVYMKQPEGFVMPGNEHKVCKLVKSLYGLKQAPKQWHQKFDEVVLSSGFHLNHSDKCVYSKFDDSDKGVIICLNVDDMLIFGADQNQVDKTKKFLSSMFSMKDMGEADVILDIKIKRENKGIVINKSYYIEKILKKFNREDCSPVSTHMDPVEKL
uniref:Zinc finger, CCHC-type n=1 Tax=Tanacetum cinerariifolium TaxID=118510 RepID=A0A699GMQ8_TANCI|nr:zinc finger, CCHC-type [Tanacetum cinerariifolium]